MRTMVSTAVTIRPGDPTDPKPAPSAISGSAATPFPYALRDGLTFQAAHTPISTIMSRDVTTVRSSVDVVSLASLLCREGIDGIPVVDEHGKLQGFASLPDVLRTMVGGDEGRLRVGIKTGGGYELGVGWHAVKDADVTVGDLMNRAVPRLPESTPITRAAAVMSFERMHHIPVVAEDNKLVGIVSALNVLEWLAQQDGYLVPLRHTQQKKATQRTTPRRVLVADDDVDMRRLVSHALKKDGCEVIEVADGAELLDYVGSSLLKENHVVRPDIIISDIRMPGFNGLQILAGLRKARWETPIILMTALDDQKTYADAARLGAAALFQKPFDTNHLRRAVRELVS